MAPTVRIVEKQKLLKTTHTTGMPNSTAVVKRTAHRQKAAVADQTDHRAIRRRPSFAPIAAAGAKPIVARPPLVMNDLRVIDRQLLACTVLVPADVGDKDGVGWRGLGDLPQQPGRVNRFAVVVLTRRQLRPPVLHARSSSCRRAMDNVSVMIGNVSRWSISCAQHGLRVADHAHVDRIDLADLLRIEIDLNETRGRNGKRVFRAPGAAVGFAKGGADRRGARRLRASSSLAARVPQMPVMPTRRADGSPGRCLCP